MLCKSVLIVEDEDGIREPLKMLLEMEGYPVFTANNGEEGLKMLRTIPHPCIILLDLLMPVMTGEEFLKAKDQDDLIASIPVCITSGVSDKPSSLHTVAYLKKPFEFSGLLKVIRQFCGQIGSNPHEKVLGRE